VKPSWSWHANTLRHEVFTSSAVTVIISTVTVQAGERKTIVGSGGVAWLWLGLRVALPLAARLTTTPSDEGAPARGALTSFIYALCMGLVCLTQGKEVR